MNTYADDHAKPCPFCGYGAATDTAPDESESWCECTNPKCEVQPNAYGPTVKDAVDNWNIRAEVQS